MKDSKLKLDQHQDENFFAKLNILGTMQKALGLLLEPYKPMLGTKPEKYQEFIDQETNRTIAEINQAMQSNNAEKYQFYPTPHKVEGEYGFRLVNEDEGKTILRFAIRDLRHSRELHWAEFGTEGRLAGHPNNPQVFHFNFHRAQAATRDAMQQNHQQWTPLRGLSDICNFHDSSNKLEKAIKDSGLYNKALDYALAELV